MAPRMVTLSRAGHLVGANSDRELARALAQSIIKINATGPLSGLTDNSGGTPLPGKNAYDPKIIALPALFAALAASGSNLATTADVNAGATAVNNALAKIVAKANAVAAAIGLAGYTYNGGGDGTTGGAETIGAIPTTVAGASTGPGLAVSQALANGVNAAIYNVANLVNRITEATGDDQLNINPANVPLPLANTASAAIPALDAGAAGTPGVSAAAWSAALVQWQNAVAALAAALVAATNPGTIRVIPIR